MFQEVKRAAESIRRTNPLREFVETILKKVSLKPDTALYWSRSIVGNQLRGDFTRYCSIMASTDGQWTDHLN